MQPFGFTGMLAETELLPENETQDETVTQTEYEVPAETVTMTEFQTEPEIQTGSMIQAEPEIPEDSRSEPSDYIWGGMFLGAVLVFAVCYPAIKEYWENHFKPKPAPKKNYIETLADPYVEHRFVQILVQTIQQNGDYEFINKLRITNSQTEIDVVTKEELVIIPHWKLGYNDLADEVLIPVTCALLLNLGDAYEMTYNEEKEPTNILRHKPRKLRNVDPPPVEE